MYPLFYISRKPKLIGLFTNMENTHTPPHNNNMVKWNYPLVTEIFICRSQNITIRYSLHLIISEHFCYYTSVKNTPPHYNNFLSNSYNILGIHMLYSFHILPLLVYPTGLSWFTTTWWCIQCLSDINSITVDWGTKGHNTTVKKG